jgi:hypothetical protein
MRIPMSELTVVDPPEAAVASPQPPATTPLAEGDATQSPNDYTVLQRGNRLQITADVDLAGIETLKAMLTDYESILRRLAKKG